MGAGAAVAGRDSDTTLSAAMATGGEAGVGAEAGAGVELGPGGSAAPVAPAGPPGPRPEESATGEGVVATGAGVGTAAPRVVDVVAAGVGKARTGVASPLPRVTSVVGTTGVVSGGGASSSAPPHPAQTTVRNNRSSAADSCRNGPFMVKLSSLLQPRRPDRTIGRQSLVPENMRPRAKSFPVKMWCLEIWPESLVRRDVF